MSTYKIPATMHGSTFADAPAVEVVFPAPLNQQLVPVKMTQQGQVAAHDLADALRHAGFMPNAIHGNTPSRLIKQKLLFQPGDATDLYLQCLALSGHPGVWHNQAHAVKYFHMQPNFDTSISTVRKLGQPGLFLPYAIALMTKAFAGSRKEFNSWEDVFGQYLAILNTPADYAAQLAALKELIKDKVVNGSYATMPTEQLKLIEAAINWKPTKKV